MSNKFLPFVVESSPPDTIFKHILKRSKGLSKIRIIEIFVLVLCENIKEIREHINKLPEMTFEALCDELVQIYPQYLMSAYPTISINASGFEEVVSQRQVFHAVFTCLLDTLTKTSDAGSEKHLRFIYSETLDELEYSDIILFFTGLQCALSKIGPASAINAKDYTEMPQELADIYNAHKIIPFENSNYTTPPESILQQLVSFASDEDDAEVVTDLTTPQRLLGWLICASSIFPAFVNWCDKKNYVLSDKTVKTLCGPFKLQRNRKGERKKTDVPWGEKEVKPEGDDET